MTPQLLKSKIHRATVTAANVNYEDSLIIERALIDAAEMREFERVLCGTLTNSKHFEPTP